MFFICSDQAVLKKYGAADGARVLQAVHALGTVLDVSGMTATQIRTLIAAQPPGPACLIGGYDLVPSFRMPNPTLARVQDSDDRVITDAPYGARPESEAECFLPTRPVTRLPDAGGKPPADDFIALLTRAAAAPAQATPSGCFEQAAKEFEGSAQLVHGILAAPPEPRLSPPDHLGTPGIAELISGRGRLHILLHGSSSAPAWSMLSGRAAGAGATFVDALSASQIQQCKLDGAIVSFTSCYAAMLDSIKAADGPRGPDNQVALACLKAGSKAVFGATRANWIDILAPFDSYGPALTAQLWRQLKGGVEAAEALRAAKWAYLKSEIRSDPRNLPYALKTVLQAHCYGHPRVTL